MRKSSKSGRFPKEAKVPAKYPAKMSDRTKQIFDSKELQCPPDDKNPIPQHKQLAGIYN